MFISDKMAGTVTFKNIDPKARKLSMIGLALGMMIVYAAHSCSPDFCTS